MRTFSRCFLPWFFTIAVPALAQPEISSIPFDSIPPETALVAPEITLDGDTSVAGELSLSEDLVLGPGTSIAYSPSRQGSLVLGGQEFAPWDNVTYWRISPSDGFAYFAVDFANGDDGVATARLPVGAAVTGFRCWFYDNNPDVDYSVFSGARLYSRPANEMTATAHWWVTGLNVSHQADALIEASGTELAALVASSATTYWVNANFSFTAAQATVASFRFYGCQIDYDLASLTP